LNEKKTAAPAGTFRLHHQISRALAWNTLLAPLKTITELVSNIIILNVLPLPHVGLLRLVSSAAASLGIWVDVGIDRSLPRFIPELEQREGRGGVRRFMLAIFLLKGALLVLFGVVFLALSPFFTSYLLDRAHGLPERFEAARTALETTIFQLAPWLVATVLALVILGSFYDGLMAYLISYFRQRAWNLIGLVGNLLQPMLAAVLVLAKQGIGGVLVAMVVTPVISVFLAGWQVLGSLREKSVSRGPVLSSPPAPSAPSLQSEGEPHRRQRQPGFWRRFFLYTGMSNVLNLGDYFLSWYFAAFLLSNLAEIALYTTGTAIVRQVLALLYTPLVGIQVPLFARVRGGDGQLPATYAIVGRILAAILIPGGVGLILLSREIILVQYPDYASAALVVSLLTPFLFLESFLSSAQIVLQVYERYWLLVLPRFLTLLVLPLLVWAAPRYGLVGVTLVIGGGRVLIGLLTALVAQRAFPLRYSWGFFGRVSLATLGMAGVVFGIKQLVGLGTIGPALGERLFAALLLLVVAGGGAACFALLLRLFGGLEPEDRRYVLESRLPLRRWLVKIL
jgi:O-antigen/teichoic acid export membrane protein